MLKSKPVNVAEMLGLTRISRVTDMDVWKHLLTPTVKGMLGPVKTVGEPVVMETIAGHFPGDDAANLNGHLLYGQTGYVRYPYISVCHRTEYGALVIKRDLRKVMATAWSGDVESGKADIVHMVAMRDRRFDGSVAANDTALLSFPYDHSTHSKRLHPDLATVELSIYSFFPDSRFSDTTDKELEKFVENPYKFLDRPDYFLQQFNRAWNTRRHPGQTAAPLRDVSKLILPAFELVARKYGYDAIEAAASHYHVMMWLLAHGFRHSYRKDLETMNAFALGMKKIRDAGHPLTRSQQSWVCVLQSLRPVELIPQHLRLDGPLWPQTNIDQQSLWLNKPISAKALALVPEPINSNPPPLVEAVSAQKT